MRKSTKQNTETALSGESQAHVRYANYAERSKKEGYLNISRLFEAASYSEFIHASNHLKALDGVQDTAANLVEGVEGELYEIEEMYPSFMAVAELQAEKKALRSMKYALETEKVHAALYKKAGEILSAGSDVEETAYFVCPVCGFTMEGEPPDTCPLCGARHETFRRF